VEELQASDLDGFRVKGPRPRWRARPADEAGVAEVLRASAQRGLAVVPRGGGTQDTWGAVDRADVWCDVTALTGIVDYEPADLTVTVRAGTRFADLQSVLAGHGQWVPLDPPEPRRATVGGVVAGGAYGPRRHAQGGPRDLVIGLRAVAGDGTPFRMGARVVKNVSGFDVGKLFVGSFGTLGVITEVSFKVRPLPAARASCLAGFADLDGAWSATLALLASELLPAAVALGEDGGRWWLAAAFEDSQRAVAYQVDRFAAMAGGGEGAFDWEAAAAPGAGSALRVRATVPAAAVPRVLRDLRAAGLHVLAYPGVGTVWGWSSGEGWQEQVRRAAAIAREASGALAVAACPDSLPVWPEAPGELVPVFRGVKERFDPAGILCPGRLVEVHGVG
jgi:glycolate oxidase FAD binding subunit